MASKTETCDNTRYRRDSGLRSLRRLFVGALHDVGVLAHFFSFLARALGVLAKVLLSGRYYHSDISGTAVPDYVAQSPASLFLFHINPLK